jgi:putative component of toxin-antitoxin plasmid stabilization module
MDSSAQLMAQTENLFIEVELREKDIPQFNTRSSAIDGPRVSKASTKEDGVVFLRNNHGIAGRIYFNADPSIVSQLAMFGYKAVEGAATSARGHWRGEYRYRVDSNEFLFKLIRNGFALGAWPKIKKIQMVAAPEAVQTVAGPTL